MSLAYSEIALSRSCATLGRVRLVTDNHFSTKKREAILLQLFSVPMGVE